MQKVKLVGFIKGRPARLTYTRHQLEGGHVHEHIASCSTMGGMGDIVFNYVEENNERLLALGRMYAEVYGGGTFNVDFENKVQWMPSEIPRESTYSIRTSEQLCADVGFTL